MKYAIFEGNMERIERKMHTIQNKCQKYGCDFIYREVGEEYRNLTDENGTQYTARFVIVEAEGQAVVGGWKFIASVEHTEKGNIIRRACDVEVPERYYTVQPICEHCNSRRLRKDTYIVMNEETGDFKQVGKSCLRDFTNGMSAEVIAQYISAFDFLIQGEIPSGGCSIEKYIDTKEFLLYAAETIRHFGYAKRDPYEYNADATVHRATDYYLCDRGSLYGATRKTRQAEMEACGFDHNSQEAFAQVNEALAWIAEQPESNNYMHNLKTALSLEYNKQRTLGILASLFPTYNRELEKSHKHLDQEKAAAPSEWVGSIGERILIRVAEISCITGWETQWGYTAIYKILDDEGNVFTWKTSKLVNETPASLKGTVKEHSEFRGTKQTELTRCKCVA